jgi:hypothetical protein
MYWELSALEVFESRLSKPESPWISTSAPVTPAHRTSTSMTHDVVFAHGIDRCSWPSGTNPQYFPIIRPHHNNPDINGHAPPPQQEGIGDTGKMNIGEGPTGHPNRSPVILIFGKTVHHGPVHQDVTMRSKLLNRRGCVSTVGHSGSEAKPPRDKREREKG